MRGRESAFPAPASPPITVPMSSASVLPSVCSFVDTFNLVIPTHGNSSEGHRDSCCPLVVTTPSRIHLGDHARDGKYILLNCSGLAQSLRLPIHKYGAPGPEDNTGKSQHQQEGIQPEVGRQPLHTGVSPKDMSPDRSFFVDTFGIRAGLGYK